MKSYSVNIYQIFSISYVRSYLIRPKKSTIDLHKVRYTQFGLISKWIICWTHFVHVDNVLSTSHWDSRSSGRVRDSLNIRLISSFVTSCSEVPSQLECVKKKYDEKDLLFDTMETISRPQTTYRVIKFSSSSRASLSLSNVAFINVRGIRLDFIVFVPQVIYNYFHVRPYHKLDYRFESSNGVVLTYLRLPLLHWRMWWDFLSWR